MNRARGPSPVPHPFSELEVVWKPAATPRSAYHQLSYLSTSVLRVSPFSGPPSPNLTAPTTTHSPCLRSTYCSLGLSPILTKGLLTILDPWSSDLYGNRYPGPRIKLVSLHRSLWRWHRQSANRLSLWVTLRLVSGISQLPASSFVFHYASLLPRHWGPRRRGIPSSPEPTPDVSNCRRRPRPYKNCKPPLFFC